MTEQEKPPLAVEVTCSQVFHSRSSGSTPFRLNTGKALVSYLGLPRASFFIGSDAIIVGFAVKTHVVQRHDLAGGQFKGDGDDEVDFHRLCFVRALSNYVVHTAASMQSHHREHCQGKPLKKQWLSLCLR